MQKTSFHIGGFWFYVTWDADGKKGVDQRGNTWYDIHNPKCEIPAIPAVCTIAHELIMTLAQ